MEPHKTGEGRSERIECRFREIQYSANGAFGTSWAYSRAETRFSLEGFAGFVLTDSEKILRFFRLVIDYSGIERILKV